MKRTLVLVIVLASACAQPAGQAGARAEPTSSALGPSPIEAVVSASPTAELDPTVPPGWESLAPVAGLEGPHVTLATTDGAVTVLAVCDMDVAAVGREGALSMWWTSAVPDWQPISVPATDRCITQIEYTDFGFFASTPGDGFWSPDGKQWQTWGVDSEINPGLVVRFGFDAIFPDVEEGRVTLLLSEPGPGESSAATLITTTDGSRWGTADDASSSAELFDNSTMTGILRGGDGLLAFGSSPGGQAEPTAAVFTSADGMSWRRVTPRSSDFENKVIRDAVAFDGGFVAVGGDLSDTGLMTAWTSPDGIAWTRSPNPDDTVDPSIGFDTANSVTISDGQLWAAGNSFDASESPDTEPAMWVSDDGVLWRRTEIGADTEPVPFVVLADSETTIGVWPPNNVRLAQPHELFRATG